MSLAMSSVRNAISEGKGLGSCEVCAPSCHLATTYNCQHNPACTQSALAC